MHCRIRLQIRQMLGCFVFFTATSTPAGALDIHDLNAAEKWKEFEQAWKNYSIAMKLHQEPEAVQVATLLSVVGADVWKVFAMYTDWASNTNQNKIQPVLQKFAAYCQPLKNVPFERCKFYSRMQESEESYDHYQTALRQLVERCEFELIYYPQSDFT